MYKEFNIDELNLQKFYSEKILKIPFTLGLKKKTGY